jgi:hypothetical protein
MNRYVPLRMGGTTTFECATRVTYIGSRGWKYIFPDGQEAYLTDGETVADEYKGKLELVVARENFHLTVPVDGEKWVGVYSCYVHNAEVYRERMAALTLIGQ